MTNVTLNIFTSSLDIEGRTIACVRQTPRGWYWFSNVGRFGRTDFPTAERALRAAAKQLGVQITEVVN